LCSAKILSQLRRGLDPATLIESTLDTNRDNHHATFISLMRVRTNHPPCTGESPSMRSRHLGAVTSITHTHALTAPGRSHQHRPVTRLSKHRRATTESHSHRSLTSPPAPLSGRLQLTQHGGRGGGGREEERGRNRSTQANSRRAAGGGKRGAPLIVGN